MIDRGGYLGPFGLALPLLSSLLPGDSSTHGFSVAEVFQVGPTAERLEDAFRGDVQAKKYVPFYASM